MEIKLLKVFIIFGFWFSPLFSIPMNSHYDSAIFYDFKGTDKYYSRKKQPILSFSLSPYYQHSSGSRGLDGSRMSKPSDGIKLGEGDRLGVWNMLGLFFGRDASPADKKFELAVGEIDKTDASYLRYPNMVLAGIVLDGDKDTKVKNPFSTQEIDDSQVEVDPDDANSLLVNFTDEMNFRPDEEFGRVSTSIDFEKLGIRTKFNFDPFKWFGMSIKTGVCHYHQDPYFEDLTGSYAGHSWDGKAAIEKSKELVKRYLTTNGITADKMKKILEDDLELNIDDYSKTTFEDTHIEAYFNLPIHLKDEDGDHAISFIPIVSFGVWAPSGENKKEKYLFSLPTGNDGYTGLTLQGSLNIDFPGTVQLAVGAGAAFFNKRELKDFHFPSSEYQYGIYPWTIDIKKRPGTTWNANFSFKAEDFLESLSFYCDFIHTQHEKDSIEFLEERKDVNGVDLFKMDKYRSESSWWNNIIFMAFDYRVAPGLQASISFQSVIAGKRVYRTTTILGAVKLNF